MQQDMNPLKWMDKKPWQNGGEPMQISVVWRLGKSREIWAQLP